MVGLPEVLTVVVEGIAFAETFSVVLPLRLAAVSVANNDWPPAVFRVTWKVCAPASPGVKV